MPALIPSERRYHAIGHTAPDPLVEFEFWHERASRVRSGLERLQLAVLEDAIASVRRGPECAPTRRQACRREDLRWFGSEDHDYAFAFQTICDLLHLNASAIRRALGVRRIA